MNFLKQPFCDILNACKENCPIIVEEINKLELDVEKESNIKNCIFSNSEGFSKFSLHPKKGKRLTMHTHFWELVLHFINGEFDSGDYILKVIALTTKFYEDLVKTSPLQTNAKFMVFELTSADRKIFQSNYVRVDIVKISYDEFVLISSKVVVDENNNVIEQEQEQSKIFTAGEIYNLFAYNSTNILKQN